MYTLADYRAEFPTIKINETPTGNLFVEAEFAGPNVPENARKKLDSLYDFVVAGVLRDGVYLIPNHRAPAEIIERLRALRGRLLRKV